MDKKYGYKAYKFAAASGNSSHTQLSTILNANPITRIIVCRTHIKFQAKTVRVFSRSLECFIKTWNSKPRYKVHQRATPQQPRNSCHDVFTSSGQSLSTC
uniref:Uncharacterized protein n=1 Tax=Rhizophora mucronata TaxID=61149 RepID=A0A2P2N8T3_RHIMU